MTEIQEFRIAIAPAALDDLHDRLARTRWPAELPGLGWERGVAPGYLRDLADYWRHDYDWRVWEAKLNQLPKVVTQIDQQQIPAMEVPDLLVADVREFFRRFRPRPPAPG